MDAPTPQNNLTIDLKIEENNTIYKLNIFNSSNSLLINISKENSFPKIEYVKDFTIKELLEKGKFFRVFEDIPSIITGLKETFENKIPKIKEENGYIQLSIIPTLLALGESHLVIPKKKSNDKEIINDLCDIVNKQGKEIESLKIKVSTLEEKIKYLYDINPKIRRLKHLNSLIGDIIKTEEQYHIICDWINSNNFYIKEQLMVIQLKNFIVNVIINIQPFQLLNQLMHKFLEDILLNLGIKIIKKIFLIQIHFYLILIIKKNIQYPIIRE